MRFLGCESTLKMAFKIPTKLQNKRASSFHTKKITFPVNLTEETEHICSRFKASTPNTTKNVRAISFIDSKGSPVSSSKGGLHPQIYDTPKRQIFDRNNSVNEYRNPYISDLIDKLTINSRSSNRNNEELKKIEQKYTTRIQELTDEVEKLKGIIEKHKQQRRLDKKRRASVIELKQYNETLLAEFEGFIKSVRENTDRLCSIVVECAGEFVINEVNANLSAFNQCLEGLKAYLGADFVISNQFYLCNPEGLQHTGRFKSLRESQNCFDIIQPGAEIKEAIALSDFDADHYGELGFKTGDRIQLIKTDDPSWWLGKIGEKLGRIPSRLVMLD